MKLKNIFTLDRIFVLIICLAALALHHKILEMNNRSSVCVLENVFSRNFTAYIYPACVKFCLKKISGN